MESSEHNPQTQERLIGDLRQVIQNAQELLLSTDHYHSAHYQHARAKLASALNTANDELERCEDAQLKRRMESQRQDNEALAGLSGEERILRAFH
jgi:ElaB/YqjD/DUF883 family membrane-anchored ribosome-binding protein